MDNQAAPRKKVRAATVFLFAFSAALSVVSMLSAASTAHATNSLSSTLTMPPNNLGLVAHWTFDGPTISGTSVTDVSGQGNTGTLEYSPPPVAGVFGQALSLNGGNQYVNCGTNNPTFNFASTSSFTESVWAYPTRVNGSWQAVFQVGRNLGLGNYQGIWLSGGNQWVFGSTGGGNLGTVYATPNKWVNITVVHTATSKAIYINGVLNTTGAGDYINGDQGGALCGIGSWGAEYFAGSVDDMRVYNRALSSYEIKQLYNAGTATHQNATINPPNLQQGLVGHWTFDGPTISGTTVKDVSGNNNNGTMVNGPTVTPGVEGQALSFNGTNQYVVRSKLLPDSTAFTISAWTYYTGSSCGIIFSDATSAAGNDLALGVDATNVYVRADKSGASLAGGGCVDGLATVPVAKISNEWVLVTWVNQGPQTLIYRNGTLAGTISASGSNVGYHNYPSIGNFQDGGSLNNAYFKGALDDVRVYNRALSATEVQQLYNLGTANHQNATVNPPNLQGGLVGHWTFDGPTISGTTVKDVSGNANNGTMVNGPAPVAGVLGQALSFNGTSQYVSVLDNNSSLDQAALTGYSISGWMKTTASYGPVVAFRDTTGNSIFGVYLGNDGASVNPNDLLFLVRNQDGSYLSNIIGPAVNSGQWVFFTGTETSSGSLSMYVNGALAGTNSQTTNKAKTFTESAIGADANWISSGFSPGSQYFPGSLDDVRIYNRALSATEVKQLYNLGR